MCIATVFVVKSSFLELKFFDFTYFNDPLQKLSFHDQSENFISVLMFICYQQLEPVEH